LPYTYISLGLQVIVGVVVVGVVVVGVVGVVGVVVDGGSQGYRLNLPSSQ
jgi:hypothetical protein